MLHLTLDCSNPVHLFMHYYAVTFHSNNVVEMGVVGPDSRLCIGLAVENHCGLANCPTPLPPPIAKSWDNDTTNAAIVFSQYLTCKAVIYTAHFYKIKTPSKGLSHNTHISH